MAEGNEAYFENGILFNISRGDQDEDAARALIARNAALISEHGIQRGFMLIDLTEAGTMEPEARKVYRAASKGPEIAKVAMVGGSVFMRTVANIVTAAAGEGAKTRFFAKHEDALKWLRS